MLGTRETGAKPGAVPPACFRPRGGRGRTGEQMRRSLSLRIFSLRGGGGVLYHRPLPAPDFEEGILDFVVWVGDGEGELEVALLFVRLERRPPAMEDIIQNNTKRPGGGRFQRGSLSRREKIWGGYVVWRKINQVVSKGKLATCKSPRRKTERDKSVVRVSVRNFSCQTSMTLRGHLLPHVDLLGYFLRPPHPGLM